MVDLHSEMYKFFKDHVSIGNEKAQLRTYRDTNIKRLNNGLTKLEYEKPIHTPTQGGYAMNTLTQRPENNPDIDHDIDISTIFNREDLPENALDARKQVLEGVIEGGGNFRKDPEARTNAVTVWYQNNYHVDLAVHRTYTNDFGEEIIEHAGVDWSKRDPKEITEWFNNKVNSSSPSSDYGATVADKQMRRIVQLLKYYSKSRSGWKLPGGLIISTLVAECYRSDYHRDDLALYNTMNAIQSRLQGNLTVRNPVDYSQELTYKTEYVNQVRRFKEKLADAIEWLAPIFTDCREDALKAWNKVFKHSYWKELADIEGAKALGEKIVTARADGSLYAGSSTKLHTSQPREKSIRISDHRFYGDEK